MSHDGYSKQAKSHDVSRKKNQEPTKAQSKRRVMIKLEKSQESKKTRIEMLIYHNFWDKQLTQRGFKQEMH